jgi:hypothetical protein
VNKAGNKKASRHEQMGSIEEVDNDEDKLVNEIDSFLIDDDDI